MSKTLKDDRSIASTTKAPHHRIVSIDNPLPSIYSTVQYSTIRNTHALTATPISIHRIVVPTAYTCAARPLVRSPPTAKAALSIDRSTVKPYYLPTYLRA
ncbi:hypothetical protein CC80DRAFT_487585, partial [Byssothecium circinans]